MRRTAAIVVVLLTPVFVLAGRLPGLSGLREYLRGLPAEAAIDYARAPGGFAPLNPSYFARLYGIPLQPGTALAAPGRPVPGSEPGREIREGAASDSFDEAVVINRVPFRATGDTRGSSRQSGEPSSCSPVGGTVWFRYTPNQDVPLIANTFGSSYPTSLGVFSGTSLSSLQPVGCMTNPRGFSYVSFEAQRRLTYYFQIGGPVGGDLHFAVDPRERAQLASTGPSDPDGRPQSLANDGDDSDGPSISADGRYVTFTAQQSMTPRGHEQCVCEQIYLRDMRKGTTRLVSAAANGAGGNGPSRQAVLSADGRWVAFQSFASDLVAGDTNGVSDVFLRDLARGTTVRISVTADGEQARPRPGHVPESATVPLLARNFDVNGSPTISEDGRVIAFRSTAANLDGYQGSCLSCTHIVVVDRSRGTVTNACVDRNGAAVPTACNLGSLSADGRYLVFEGMGSNFVEGDDNDRVDVFLRDLRARKTSLISVGTSGEIGNGESHVWSPDYHVGGRHVSRNGRWVVFSSIASNFAKDDIEGTQDIFVHDRLAGVTTRVTPPASTSTQGAPPLTVTMSDDGRIVAFSGSDAFLPEDDNGINDVYVKDLRTGLLIIATTFPAGNLAGGRMPALSGDGRWLAFTTFGGLAESGDSPDQDVYVRRLPVW